MAKGHQVKKPASAGTSFGFPEDRVVLRMVNKNVPLSQWRSYSETGDGYGFFSRKKADHIASSIFTQLSHPEAVKIVAHEWDHLGPDIRIQLGTLASKGNASGNVIKGCQELNRLLNGRLFREDKQITTRINGRTLVVNPAIAGASRKYQNLNTPGYGVKHLSR
jgi:hypothetical protein